MSTFYVLLHQLELRVENLKMLRYVLLEEGLRLEFQKLEKACPSRR
jgi:hypothetical protein